MSDEVELPKIGYISMLLMGIEIAALSRTWYEKAASDGVITADEVTDFINEVVVSTIEKEIGVKLEYRLKGKDAPETPTA